MGDRRVERSAVDDGIIDEGTIVVSPDKLCAVCDRPLYLGGADTRCRCDGQSLRAEIEKLRVTLVKIQNGTTDTWAENKAKAALEATHEQ